MKSKEKIFVANSHYYLIPFVFYYYLKGHEVYLYDFGNLLFTKRLWKKIITKKIAKHVYIMPNIPEHGNAIDKAKEYCDKQQSSETFSNGLKAYYDQTIGQSFCRLCCENIFRINYFFREIEILDSTQQKCICLGLFFYSMPKQLRSMWQNETMKHKGLFKFNTLDLFINFLHTQLLQAFEILKTITAVVIVVLFRVLNFFSIKHSSRENDAVKNKTFQNAFAITNPFQIKFSKGRSFDFFLDDKNITKQNSIFIFSFDIPVSLSKKLNEEKYNYKIVSSSTYLRDSTCKITTLLQLFFKVFHIVFIKNKILPFSGKIVFNLVTSYIKGNSLIANFSTKNYIYSNMDMTPQIILNSYLRKNEIIVWHYSMFMGGGYLRSRDSSFVNTRNILFSFQNPNYSLVYSEDTAKFYSIHKQMVDKFIPIGSIFSEKCIDCNSDKIEDANNIDQVDIFLKKWNNKKVIVVFDTIFLNTEDCPSSFTDGIGFYNDIGQLVSTFLDIVVIVKPARDNSYFTSNDYDGDPEKTKKLINAIESLKTTERVFWAGTFGDPTDLIARSDITITHCMSSPAGDTWAACKKGFWYESTKRHTTINYAKIPGIIISGKDKLFTEVEKLLKTKDEDYIKFLNDSLVPNVIANLNNKALTQFRKMLCQ